MEFIFYRNLMSTKLLKMQLCVKNLLIVSFNKFFGWYQYILKVLCHFRIDEEQWHWQLYFCSKLTFVFFYIFRWSSHYLILKWWLRPAAFIYLTIIHFISRELPTMRFKTPIQYFAMKRSWLTKWLWLTTFDDLTTSMTQVPDTISSLKISTHIPHISLVRSW